MVLDWARGMDSKRWEKLMKEEEYRWAKDEYNQEISGLCYS